MIDDHYCSSSDAFTILPIVDLGMRYVAVGISSNLQFPNAIMAVAEQDDTIVRLILILYVIILSLQFADNDRQSTGYVERTASGHIRQ